MKRRDFVTFLGGTTSLQRAHKSRDERSAFWAARFMVQRLVQRLI